MAENDIIERLRAESDLLAKLECTMNPSPQAQVILDAAAEIDRLRRVAEWCKRRLGHVYPRADGVKARCGGPAICRECAADFVKLHGASYQTMPPAADTAPRGCICPPGAEVTCQGWMCPRRAPSFHPNC